MHIFKLGDVGEGVGSMLILCREAVVHYSITSYPLFCFQSTKCGSRLENLVIHAVDTKRR